MPSAPLKPDISPEMQSLMVDSGCELRLVGGLNVGHTCGELKWAIRSKYEAQIIRKNSEYARKLASAARKISALETRIKELNG